MVNEDKMKALDAAISNIEKQFGKGSVMKLGESTANLTAGTGQVLNILLTIQMKQEIFTLLPGKIRLYMMPPAIPILMLPM